MRRHQLALLLFPLVLVACASEPPRLAGSYVIELDAKLAEKPAARGLMPLHEAVILQLARRLNVVTNAAEADAVILLKSELYGRLGYEIRRGGVILAQSAPIVLPPRISDARTIGERLEDQRREEYARGNHSIVLPKEDQLRPPTADLDTTATPQSELHTAAVRFAERIVYDLGQR